MQSTGCDLLCSKPAAGDLHFYLFAPSFPCWALTHSGQSPLGWALQYNSRAVLLDILGLSAAYSEKSKRTYSSCSAVPVRSTPSGNSSHTMMYCVKGTKGVGYRALLAYI